MISAQKRGLGVFFESQHGIRNATGPELPQDDLDAVGELILTLFDGLFLRMQVYRDHADLDRLFSSMRSAILLLVRERVECARLNPQSI